MYVFYSVIIKQQSVTNQRQVKPDKTASQDQEATELLGQYIASEHKQEQIATVTIIKPRF